MRRFTKQTGQTIDCLIAALDPDDTRSAKEIVASDCDDAYVVINAFDSSTWTVRSKEELPPQDLP